MKPIHILGVMSGTSLDGLDLALCQFETQNNVTTFNLLSSKTINYSTVWKERLVNVFDASALQYAKLNSLYGNFIAEEIKLFLNKTSQTLDYIASHGHTVFHQPQNRFTTQLGCGATIAAKTGIATICDFRSTDVALGGQGAPLVPIGDRDLFANVEACLNLGGIANISFTQNGITKAFDICIINMAFNYLTELIGKPFDDGGNIASSGIASTILLQKLLQLNSNNQSLGREWFEQHIKPLLDEQPISVPDKLATCVIYSAQKINECLQTNNINSVLVTGGGAYNNYFINELKKIYNGNITIPSDEIIQFKEALIFAYLGYLRILQKPNALASVTGATKNSVGGCVYL